VYIGMHYREKFERAYYTNLHLYKTKMWAKAQRDGRPAEYRWRPFSALQTLADAYYYSAVQ